MLLPHGSHAEVRLVDTWSVASEYSNGHHHDGLSVLGAVWSNSCRAVSPRRLASKISGAELKAGTSAVARPLCRQVRV